MKTATLLLLLTLGFVRAVIAADAPPTEAIVLEHGKVDNAFAKGLPLLINPGYKIQTGRRVVPGVVEYHEHDTDILYITEGTATVVTGAPWKIQKRSGQGKSAAIKSPVAQHINSRRETSSLFPTKCRTGSQRYRTLVCT